ncbi:hypothetical protein Tco_0067914 [Tanacetum coccineum]
MFSMTSLGAHVDESVKLKLERNMFSMNPYGELAAPRNRNNMGYIAEVYIAVSGCGYIVSNWRGIPYGYDIMESGIFKYISKGTDRVVARIARNTTNVQTGASESTNQPQVVIDEIKNFLDARYVSPHEACWRLFEFEIHYREPAVQILVVHLQNMQRIVFKEKDKLDSLVVNPYKKNHFNRMVVL